MITTQEYKTLDDAYTYFNKKLFDNKLSECLITFQRHHNTLGYYHHEKFSSRDGKGKISELALNPDLFEDRTDMEILSTLCHEQCHVLQYMLGDAPRKGYHDKNFAQIMLEVGLQVSSTGEAGGKTTGQKMSHFIMDGGKFEITAGAFLLDGKKLFWNSIQETKDAKERKKTRWKYTCPKCLTNAWAKKDAHIDCGDCHKGMIVEEENG